MNKIIFCALIGLLTVSAQAKPQSSPKRSVASEDNVKKAASPHGNHC